jgi:hypothetical protein
MKDEMKRLVPLILIVTLVAGLGGCCCQNSSNKCDGLKLHPIFQQAIIGAIIGGIIGHQSNEDGEGAAVGAAVLGVAELLSQTDQQCKARERARKASEQVVVEIHNSNGSTTPVRLKKKDGVYIGPKGERYDHLPTEEQLKPLYGL